MRRRFTAIVDARTPRGHDRFSETTGAYAARLLEYALASSAVAVPSTAAVQITGWDVAPHPRGAVLTIECTARNRSSAEAALRALLPAGGQRLGSCWAPFATWVFKLAEIHTGPEAP
ncbi:hypothetical protein [Nocardiopsis composta]|uniref:Uncharacterized protein n=1 Tax=Nocardiopsis composta TaxID=157465 RepID=A0A7W8QH53_9ACTN|nr:hypothetical protein [Nocardiopsis composta]MBB5429944.1 hypothetical protein [Nocardiopsis composta]